MSVAISYVRNSEAIIPMGQFYYGSSMAYSGKGKVPYFTHEIELVSYRVP